MPSLQHVRAYAREHGERLKHDIEVLRRAAAVLPPGHALRDGGLDSDAYDCLGAWGVPLSSAEQVRRWRKTGCDAEN